MVDFKEALTTLKNNDPKLGLVIELIKPEYKKEKIDEFESLIKIIIGQQLSGPAARTIINRVKDSIKDKKITPKVISNLNHQDLRLCGISNAKINYIKGLSNILLINPKFFYDLKKQNETEIINELCKIKGIGVWTASIFAMGALSYEDIFPFGDVSLIKAIKNLYGEAKSHDYIISKWSPYKSYASRVLWQWVDKGMPNID